MIQDSVTAKEFRQRTLDANELKSANDIYIGTGVFTTNPTIYNTEVKNIIEVINDATATSTGRTINGSAISGKVKEADEADHAKSADEATLATNATNAVYSEYAKYADDTPESIAKGTIEERLNNLGFRQLSSDINVDITTPNTATGATKIGELQINAYSLTREGNRVNLVGYINLSGNSNISLGDDYYNFYFNSSLAVSAYTKDEVIPKNFRPSNPVSTGASNAAKAIAKYYNTNNDELCYTQQVIPMEIRISDTGRVTFERKCNDLMFYSASKADDNKTERSIDLQRLSFTIGYEADPIKP